MTTLEGVYEAPEHLVTGSPEWHLWAMEIRQTYEARREALKAAKERAESESDSDDDVAAFRVTERGRKSPPEEWPTAVKKLVNEISEDMWAKGARWDFVVQRSVTEHEPVFFKKASSEGDKKPHSKGDPRWPAKTLEHFGVQAILGETAKFWATWDRRDGARTSFIESYTWDPILGARVETMVGEFTEWRKVFLEIRPAAREEPDALRAELEKGEWHG